MQSTSTRLACEWHVLASHVPLLDASDSHLLEQCHLLICIVRLDPLLAKLLRAHTAPTLGEQSWVLERVWKYLKVWEALKRVWNGFEGFENLGLEWVWKGLKGLKCVVWKGLKHVFEKAWTVWTSRFKQFVKLTIITLWHHVASEYTLLVMLKTSSMSVDAIASFPVGDPKQLCLALWSPNTNKNHICGRSRAQRPPADTMKDMCDMGQTQHIKNSL